MKLRQTARIVMDLDNVERGAGGKNQIPHDHNRDWSEQPRYPEVAAAQDWIKRQRGTRLRLVPRSAQPGPGDGKPFFFGSPDSHLNPKSENQKRRALPENLGQTSAFSEKVRVTGAGYHPLWRRDKQELGGENTAPRSVNLTSKTTWNSPHSTRGDTFLRGRPGKTLLTSRRPDERNYHE